MARRKRRGAARRGRSATRKTRSATVRWAVNPRRRRVARRRYRRNPGFGNIGNTLIGGLQNGAAVTAGRWGTGYLGSLLAGMIPTLGVSADIQKAIGEAISALGVALVVGNVRQFGRFAPFIVAGGFSRPMETLVKSAGIDIVNSGLSAYPAMNAYPPVRTVNGMSSYPSGALPFGAGGTGAYPPRRATLAGDGPAAYTWDYYGAYPQS